ncbi:hypothetical protein VTN96DRAFT_3495 [Rasamsonia emersonii]
MPATAFLSLIVLKISNFVCYGRRSGEKVVLQLQFSLQGASAGGRAITLIGLRPGRKHYLALPLYST